MLSIVTETSRKCQRLQHSQAGESLSQLNVSLLVPTDEKVFLSSCFHGVKAQVLLQFSFFPMLVATTHTYSRTVFLRAVTSVRPVIHNPLAAGLLQTSWLHPVGALN